MAKGIIRVNPDRTLAEIVTPEGEEWGPETYPAGDEDSLIIMSDEDKPGEPSYVAVLDGYGNLKPFTLYRLTEVGTSMEETELSEDDLDDDDEDDQESSSQQ